MEKKKKMDSLLSIHATSMHIPNLSHKSLNHIDSKFLVGVSPTPTTH